MNEKSLFRSHGLSYLGRKEQENFLWILYFGGKCLSKISGYVLFCFSFLYMKKTITFSMLAEVHGGGF